MAPRQEPLCERFQRGTAALHFAHSRQGTRREAGVSGQRAVCACLFKREGSTEFEGGALIVNHPPREVERLEVANFRCMRADCLGRSFITV